MQVIAIDKMLKEVPNTELRKHLPAELEATIRLYLEEKVRAFYFRQDRPGIVLILEVESVDQARTYLNALPLVEVGILDFDLIPVGPLKPLGQLFPGLKEEYSL